MAGGKGPSRFNSAVTNTWNKLKPMLDEMEQEINEFESVNDISQIQEAIKKLKKFSDEVETKHDSLKMTLNNWRGAINDTDDNRRDYEQSLFDQHLITLSMDEEEVETQVTEFSSTVKKTIKRMMENLETEIQLKSVMAKQKAIDDETTASKESIEKDRKAKEQAIEIEKKTRQDALETEAAIRKDALKKEIERERAVKEEILEKQREAQLNALKDGTNSVRMSPGPAGDQSPIQNIIVQSPNHTLPGLELPIFDGTLWKYAEFEQLFKTLIDDDQSLTDIQRHQYLRQCLRGEALDVILHVSKTAECYAEAKALLKESFHKPMRYRQAIQQRMNDLSCNKNSLQSQLSMTRQAKAIIKELEKVEGEGKANILQTSHIAKYSEDVQKRAYKKLRSNQDMSIFQTLKVIEEFLEEQIDIHSSIQASNHSKSYDSTQSRRPFSNSNANNGNDRRSSSGYRDNRNGNQMESRNNNAASFSNNNSCMFCDGNHGNQNCNKSIDDKWNAIKAKRICGRCLQQGHEYKRCRINCAKCSGRHHALLCRPNAQSDTHNTPLQRNAQPSNQRQNGNNNQSNQGRNNNGQMQTVAAVQAEQNRQSAGVSPIQGDQSSPQTVAAIQDSRMETPYMFLGKVTVVNRISNKEKEVDCFVDPGAMPTLMTETLANELELPIIDTRSLDIVVPGALKLVNKIYDFTEVTVKCENINMIIRPALFKQDITGPILKRALSKKDKDYVRKHKIHLSDNPNREEVLKPPLLIGMGAASNLFRHSNLDMKVLPSGLMLLSSAIGYLVGGVPDNEAWTELSDVRTATFRPTNHDKRPDIQLNFVSHSQFNEQLETKIEKFLRLDEAGQGIETTEREIRKQEGAETDKHFDDTVHKDGSNYVVQYRLKDNISELPDNKGMAFKRLESELRKLKGNAHYLEHYDKIFKDQLAADQIEMVDDSEHCPYTIH